MTDFKLNVINQSQQHSSKPIIFTRPQQNLTLAVPVAAVAVNPIQPGAIQSIPLSDDISVRAHFSDDDIIETGSTPAIRVLGGEQLLLKQNSERQLTFETHPEQTESDIMVIENGCDEDICIELQAGGHTITQIHNLAAGQRCELEVKAPWVVVPMEANCHAGDLLKPEQLHSTKELYLKGLDRGDLLLDFDEHDQRWVYTLTS